MTRRKEKEDLAKDKRHIPIALISCSPSSQSSLESETLIFMTGSSAKSSRTSLDLSSKYKSASSPQVAEIRRDSDHQRGVILHDQGEGSEGIAGGDDKNGSRRSTLSLRYTCRSGLILASRNLSRNRNRLTNPLGLGILFSRNELRWRS